MHVLFFFKFKLVGNFLCSAILAKKTKKKEREREQREI